MRGYNLDHGTDLATIVDFMPINQPTHAHGQGYTDLNFMIPEEHNPFCGLVLQARFGSTWR